jgi:hypothetical protein
MGFSNVLVRGQSKVWRVYYVTEDAIVQLISHLLSMLQTEVVGDEPGRDTHHFNQLVLEDHRLARQ